MTTTPDEARALLAAAHARMTPHQISEHALALAGIVASLDSACAALCRNSGLPYTEIEDLFGDVFGVVTLSAPEAADG